MDGLPIGNQQNTNDFNVRAVEIEKRCPNHRMMRSGKTEDAMCATPTIGIAGGQLRSALAVVDTKLKALSVVGGMGRGCEACKDKQKALRSDCMRCDNANQRPEKPLGHTAWRDHQSIPDHQLGPRRTESQR